MKRRFAGHWSNTPEHAHMLATPLENGETASQPVVNLPGLIGDCTIISKKKTMKTCEAL